MICQSTCVGMHCFEGDWRSETRHVGVVVQGHGELFCNGFDAAGREGAMGSGFGGVAAGGDGTAGFGAGVVTVFCGDAFGLVG